MALPVEEIDLSGVEMALPVEEIDLSGAEMALPGGKIALPDAEWTLPRREGDVSGGKMRCRFIPFFFAMYLKTGNAVYYAEPLVDAIELNNRRRVVI